MSFNLPPRTYVWQSIFGFVFLLTLGFLGSFLGVLLWKGFLHLELSMWWTPSGYDGTGGFFYQLVGTGIIVLTTAVVTIPVSVGLTLTREEWVSNKTRTVLDGTLYAMNTIPSIVLGVFGYYCLFSVFGVQKVWWAAGIILAMMITPTVTATYAEEYRSMRSEYYEQLSALGLSPIPYLLKRSLTGLLSGLSLGIGRAAGETAPIMFTATVFTGVTLPDGWVDSPILALPYHLFYLAQEARQPAAYDALWGGAVTLLLLSGTLMALSYPLRRRDAI